MRMILGRIALPSEPGPPQNGVQERGAGGEQCQEFCWKSKMLTTCSGLGGALYIMFENHVRS
jgi:hypothetical protein